MHCVFLNNGLQEALSTRTPSKTPLSFTINAERLLIFMLLTSLLTQLKKPNEFKRQVVGERGSEKPLSKREVEVLELLAKGKSNKEIAREFCITESTVKFHVSNILCKLGLKNRVQVIIYAHRHNLID